MSEKARQANRLNDLGNREWLVETKSFWFSQAPPRDKLKSQHPATFSEKDIERLIRLFTKSAELVLDPFLGSGSTLLACHASGRRGVGIELIPKWAQVARERLGLLSDSGDYQVIEGDALTQLAALEPDSFDFLVTSPPYWSILEKKGMKVQAERQNKGLPTKYSDNPHDLGNITDYEEFLDRLAEVFAEGRRVLKPGRYAAVIVSDFRHGPKFVLFHADLARRLEEIGLALKGITLLLQDNKNLYPFGVGHSFVSNIHHQYILIHQKPR